MTGEASCAGGWPPPPLRRFFHDTYGAVAVDRTLLMAAIIDACIAMFASIPSGEVRLGDRMSAALGWLGVCEPGGLGQR
ncbi:hypothetical protein B5V46_10215 [Rhodovulum sp. MB263]|nr:hypothetical protein B5V46_10215 [Rhodovulum sp. MB263]